MDQATGTGAFVPALGLCQPSLVNVAAAFEANCEKPTVTRIIRTLREAEPSLPSARRARPPESPIAEPDGAKRPVAMNGAGTDGATPARRAERIVDLCVVGLGYIGLPTAAVFAASGLTVTGVDIDAERIDRVNAGTAGLDEDGLGRVVAKAISERRLTAAAAPVPARAFIIAVPTPLTPAKQPDLSHVHAAAAAVAPNLVKGSLVVLESTVPVGATAALAARLAAARPDLSFPGGRTQQPDVRVAHCPERVLPGRILEELRRNDRVIGGLDPASTVAATALFRRICDGRCHQTDAQTAEMTKLAENAYRDVNIAYANELALIAEAQGIDARAMIDMANRHPRVDILQPGPGVGGHCIAVDPWFLSASAGGRSRLIPMARAVNDARPGQIAAQALDMVRDRASPIIACLGLGYKRDVADLRESPALEVTRLLATCSSVSVLVVEPFLDSLPGVLDGATLTDAGTALASADLVLLLVDHTAFAGLFRSVPPRTQVLDTRGMWNRDGQAAVNAMAGPVAAAAPTAARSRVAGQAALRRDVTPEGVPTLTLVER